MRTFICWMTDMSGNRVGLPAYADHFGAAEEMGRRQATMLGYVFSYVEEKYGAPVVY